MKQKTTFFIIIIIFIILIGAGFYFSQKTKDFLPNLVSQKDPGQNFYSISQIKQGNLPFGNYQTQGYVVKIYTCPACPPPSQCKPCMGNNIVISELQVLRQNYNLTNQDLLIFTDDPNQFELGKKYQSTVRLTEIKSTNEPINDVELGSFQAMD